MTHFGQCPMCNDPITLEQKVGDSIICKCGWTTNIKKETKTGWSMDLSSLTIVIFALVMVGTFIQAVNWNNHMLSIVPLKVKQTLGLASTADLTQISEICLERKKYDCVKEAYQQTYAQDPKQIETLAKLGKIQQQTNQIQASVDSYRMYFTQGGEDLRARYEYAKGLGLVGEVQDSRKHFRIVLRAKPNVLQVTVARAYIDMLMTNNKWSDAKSAIRYFRRLGSNTGMFLEEELQRINKEIGGNRKTAGA